MRNHRNNDEKEPAPMTTTLETLSSMKPREPLEKPFNVLFTESMYLRLHSYASGLGVSKGRFMREALEEHFQKIDAETRHDH
jgi:hypothetical protein